MDLDAGLVGLTVAIGALFGFVFAIVWNWLSVRSEAMGYRPGLQHTLSP